MITVKAISESNCKYLDCYHEADGGLSTECILVYYGFGHAQPQILPTHVAVCILAVNQTAVNHI